MLSRLQLHKPLSNQEIAHLRKKKLIEGRKNAPYISKSVASNIGKKAEYTQNKGLDDSFYKELIINSLKQHGELKRKEINELLLPKLPDSLNKEQKNTKISNLLRFLKKEGKIDLGPTRLWILCQE